MLAALRSNTKAILWIVVVAFVGFIFAAWGRGLQRTGKGPERGVIGRVNGRVIEYRDFSESLRARIAEYVQRTGGDVSDATRDAIVDETWQAMVSEILIDDEIGRLGIDVSNDLVFEVLWNNPPDAVMRSPAFQDEDGNFDVDQYHRQIQLHPERWEGVAELYRHSLKRQILTQEIQAGAFVSDNELWEEFVAVNEMVRVSYVAIDPQVVSTGALMPTDDEARAYYDLHRVEYERPATTVLAYVELPKLATSEDEEDIVDRLKELADAVREGEDFGDLAEVYSEGPSAPQGGDLGYFAQGMMVPAFEEVAFNLDVGEISDPFKTEFGYHIVKVEDRRHEEGQLEVRASHILIKLKPSEQTLVELEETLGDLADRARNEDLASAAAVMGLEVRTTPPFADGKYIPTIGNMRPAVKIAFESDAGTVFGPYMNAEAYYMFEVAERIPSWLPTYEDLAREAEGAGRQHSAKTALMYERQRDRAAATADEIVSRVSTGATLEDAAAANGYTVEHTELFTRRDYIPGVGRDNAFVGTSFALRTGATSGVVETENPTRYYIIRVEEKSAADEKLYAEQRDELWRQLIGVDQFELLSSWLEDLTAKAKIEDFRDLYY